MRKILLLSILFLLATPSFAKQVNYTYRTREERQQLRWEKMQVNSAKADYVSQFRGAKPLETSNNKQTPDDPRVINQRDIDNATNDVMN